MEFVAPTQRLPTDLFTLEQACQIKLNNYKRFGHQFQNLSTLRFINRVSRNKNSLYFALDLLLKEGLWI